MEPSIGRIVHYHPNEHDAPLIAAAGNSVKVGEPIAAVIVKVWSNETVNLMVLPDGPSPLWRTSVPVAPSDADVEAANGRSCWTWPPRV